MGSVKNIKVIIEGQVSDDYNDNQYEILLAELRLLCAKYHLDCTEEQGNW